MKKIAILSALICAMCLAGCRKAPELRNFEDAERAVYADYNYVKSIDPDAVFYESYVVMNMRVDEVSNAYYLYAVTSENVFQVGDTVYLMRRNFPYWDFTVEKVGDLWVGDYEMFPSDFKYSFDQALECYFRQSIFRTTGNKVVLRQPVYKDSDSPLYIIGQHNSPYFVSIDAITGVVKCIPGESVIELAAINGTGDAGFRGRLKGTE